MWADWQTLFSDDQPDEARLEALLAIQQYTLTRHGRKHIKALLEDTRQSDKLRAAVVMVLGNSLNAFDSLSDWQWLHPYLSEAHSPLIRRCAIQTIVDSQNPDLIPWLTPCLQHEDKAVFADAAQALGQFGYAAVEPLGDLLQNADLPPDVQCVAAWQLGEIKSFNSVKVLLPVVTDSGRHTDVRALAIWALGQIGLGTAEVIKALQACKQETEPDIRLRAETALRKIMRNAN